MLSAAPARFGRNQKASYHTDCRVMRVKLLARSRVVSTRKNDRGWGTASIIVRLTLAASASFF